MHDWLTMSLRRKLLLGLAASLTLASIGFLALLLGNYRNRMLEERTFASIEINRLLQVTLENAMLKRDIDGLREMVTRLGRQDKIANVMILAPDGETRFASNPKQLGRRFNLAKGELCPGCPPPADASGTHAALLSDPIEGDVLRSINPVRNREPCLPCHGKAELNPINGILVVDYAATQIRHDIRLAMLALSGAGLVVLLAAVSGIGWMVNRSVLAPISKLTSAADEMQLSDLGRRVPTSGSDEMARLGNAFNAMAERIEKGVHEVAERERFLQALIDAMPDGVRVIDRNYRVVKANHAFCQQQDLSFERVLAEPCYRSSHRRTTPCAPTLVTCPLHEIGNGGASLACRHRHVRNDGTELQVEVSAAPCNVSIPGSDGALIVEVIRDLSKDIHSSHEQRLSEIGLLAAGVAHEIHNPLASIHLGFASVNRELASGNYDNVTKYVNVIDEQIERCIEVTARLLKLSASPSDQHELVVLNDVVPDVLSLLSAEAERNHIRLESRFDGMLRVIGSDNEMRMVVLNLAQNALHAMPKGGLLTVSGHAEADKVILAFQDSGIGIAAEDMVRIFHPFWSRRGDGVNGTGLGLPICREIVTKIGGIISVESKVGEGTRFTVTLPSADAEVKPT